MTARHETEPTAEVDARFSDEGATATPWERVREVLEKAELFWISTVRADGRPHVTPLPTVWRDGAIHFCTGPTEQKGVNLAANAACVLTSGNNEWKSGLDVVVEGSAQRITDDASLRELAALWESKYDGDWKFDVADGVFHHGAGEAYVFEVRPSKVLAFAKGDFVQTRYRFAS